MKRSELIKFCEQEIRQHSEKVRALLDLLHAARMLPDDWDKYEEEENAS
jgi:hypothetical protein